MGRFHPLHQPMADQFIFAIASFKAPAVRVTNQKILNTTQSMILVLDTAGLISYANRRCFEAGYREDELIGHRLVEWVEPSHRSDFEAALETTAHGQQVENLELRVRRSDASMGHFSISLSPMRDEQNTVNSVVVVMT